ncbi:hypothetical protein PF005_g1860 [Phytophthora fragariae]|uniref:Coiled-coil SMC6 And NSE5 INteracting (CANIN) domain-containing protein n=1 Tax=Phytophthora fragariae TaxID=53985 RepID=A0A6A4A891_9STRA|nr:hypothetical protein PF003_g29192 [Phytophthora fragariae]KAE8947447.1 hypothetical protein PF009_g2958 [Phytophthora fragariae]KAE9135038.1 hypothetical protein PF007_g2712 [Phytophthora fragariae]KAE9153619.1 hypothetical protein PF006_g2278 [Phytophthora fragariae]KAE9234562.1 hypothetical protein PF005_g1860 [Phytophthora fragariae]
MARAAPSRTRAAKAPTASASAHKRRRSSLDSSSSDDEKELVRDSRRGRARGKRPKASAILAEFTSLDALLSNDQAEKRKRQNRERKLQKLREESEAAAKDAAEGGSSSMGKLMTHMASNMSALSGDSHLFSGSEVTVAEEKFGYVFTPITEPLPYRTYKATETELQGDLKLVYETMQSTDDAELSGLLWSKAILIRCMLKRQEESTTRGSATTPILLPSKIGSWLFMTMSTHSNSHVVSGCFSNLFLVMSSAKKAYVPSLSSALPAACFAHSIEDFRSTFGVDVPPMEMEWKPSIYDFLNAFRAYGFQDSKRSMSVKSKIPVTPPSTKKTQALPFPTVNMHYVLMYLVICLRTKTLKLEGYDAFSFTMFFLRMQFETDIHASIVDLATICIEELLDVFPRAEWRREWAPQLVLRIAGSNEGLFDSAAGWLAVARRLPRTMRGTLLTTGLAIYVLQHRIDKKPAEGVSSERPLKFPIQSGLVVDIVAGIVEDLTSKYAEARKNGKASKVSPPFDLLCKKVALMDLALQAFLNILTPKEMKIMLGKLDQLADAHKSTMSAKWHELKTLVSLMHRKYSLENLRIGRSASPSAKTVLFCDDDDN